MRERVEFDEGEAGGRREGGLLKHMIFRAHYFTKLFYLGKEVKVDCFETSGVFW